MRKFICRKFNSLTPEIHFHRKQENSHVQKSALRGFQICSSHLFLSSSFFLKKEKKKPCHGGEHLYISLE